MQAVSPLIDSDPGADIYSKGYKNNKPTVGLEIFMKSKAQYHRELTEDSRDCLPYQSISGKLPSIPLYGKPAPQVRIPVCASPVFILYKKECDGYDKRNAVT
jgi:hypothetical protein